MFSGIAVNHSTIYFLSEVENTFVFPNRRINWIVLRQFMSEIRFSKLPVWISCLPPRFATANTVQVKWRTGNLIRTWIYVLKYHDHGELSCRDRRCSLYSLFWTFFHIHIYHKKQMLTIAVLGTYLTVKLHIILNKYTSACFKTKEKTQKNNFAVALYKFQSLLLTPI